MWHSTFLLWHIFSFSILFFLVFEAYPAFFNLQGCHNLTFVTRSERCKSDVKLINKWKIFLVPFFQFLFSVCYRSFIKLLSVVKALADFPFSIFFVVVVVVVMMQYLSSSDLCVCKIVCLFFFSLSSTRLFSVFDDFFPLLHPIFFLLFLIDSASLSLLLLLDAQLFFVLLINGRRHIQNLSRYMHSL